MKGLCKVFFVIGLFFSATAYSYSYESVEFYNDGSDPCCDAFTFKGLYIGINAGYSRYNFFIHRPNLPGLLPLDSPKVRLNSWVPILAVGYDLYPRRRIPLRFEVNFTYEDTHFSKDPLFESSFDPDVFTHDSFRMYNTMATLYLDLHTCTRFVPFIGVSGGRNEIVTGHEPTVRGLPRPKSFDHKKSELSYGGTFGTRFFFTNHFVGNLQFRFNDLREISFHTENGLDYLSDFFHETTVIFGIAYEF